MKAFMVRSVLRVLKALVVLSTFHAIADEDVSTGIYTGTINAVQFESNGSFSIQLNINSQKTSTPAVKCESQTTFLVQQNYEGLTPRELKRMRDDVRQAFFSEKEPSISLKVYGCHKEKGFPLVGNVILGSWQDNE